MSDWHITPRIKVRAHAQYLDLLSHTVSRCGKEFSENRVVCPKGLYRNGYSNRALNYCLDIGFLVQSENSSMCSVTVEGERALEDLKQYRIKRQIEILQKKKKKIEDQIATLQKAYRQA